MIEKIARKRTSFETAAWEQVRELMPRRQATRGIQYEALEYLFEHLYEKISEEQLKEHFLEVKGHLQQKGDPVKSAINLAVKELQRLHEPTFELIKIQEASLVGKMRRYVQLNFTGFDSVIGYDELESYLDDILSGEELPIIRSVSNHHPAIEPTIFPCIKAEWLNNISTFALISSFEQIVSESAKTQYSFIPESQCNQCFLLLYENDASQLPFLGFVSDISGVKEKKESRYIVYRGEEKLARLEFYHRMWSTQAKVAIPREEVEEMKKSIEQLAPGRDNIDPGTILSGMITQKSRQNWFNTISSPSAEI